MKNKISQQEQFRRKNQKIASAHGGILKASKSEMKFACMGNRLEHKQVVTDSTIIKL